ncbi:MAG: spore coat U domain-containing protein [Deltaproteobacteria bacterium]|nr:spore coat U domain-containing protein [Deltaproteobacteria bacterium]
MFGRNSFLAISIFLFICEKAIGFCTITASNLTFSEYNPLSSSHTDYTGILTIYCDKTSNVQVSIGPSSNSGFNPRRLRNVEYGEMLNYNIYTDAARTRIWGDGTSGTYTVRANVKKNSSVLLKVYGRVFATQEVGTGFYTDQLAVTISY